MVLDIRIYEQALTPWQLVKEAFKRLWEAITLAIKGDKYGKKRRW